MQSGVKVALWALTGVLAVCTLLSNSYILFASLAAWRQQQRKGGGGGGGGATGGGGRGPGETITAALSLACCAHQLACYLWMTMDEVDRHCRLALNGYTATLLLAYSFKFTALWDSALLTYYYCSKLVRGPGPGGGGPPGGGCPRLQAAVLSHAPAAVLLVLLLGLGTCLPMFAVFQPENSTATTGAANQDCGVLVAAGGSALLYEVAYILLADVLPGALMVRCCVSISTHLAAHLRNMKAHSGAGGAGGKGDVARRRPRLGAQMRVIRMALSLVAVFAVFLAVDLYVQYQITVHHENIISLAFFFTSVYTAAAAAVLVYGRRSLWKALIHELNGLLDEFPCLSCLKLPEQRDAARTAAMGATVVKL